MKPLIAKNAFCTSIACPSQWEGNLENGKTYYIRYRWGNLTVDISKMETENFLDAVSGENIFDKEIGDSLDGFITYSDMRNEVKEVIALPERQIMDRHYNYE